MKPLIGDYPGKIDASLEGRLSGSPPGRIQPVSATPSQTAKSLFCLEGGAELRMEIEADILSPSPIPMYYCLG